MTNFFKALEEFIPPVVEQLEYRIYYDIETGKPYSLSTEKLKGEYIVVSKEQFESVILSRIRIKDGAIKYIDFRPKNVLKLQLDSEGEFTTVANDMMIVSTTGDRYSIKKHE
jgi:hypothetical protein